MSSATSNPFPRQPDTAALGLSMTRVLANPLAALRASIESLAAGIQQEDPRGRMLEGALEQVARMARDLQSLVDYAAPRPLAPLRCSLDEIAFGVVRCLPKTLRSRLQLARPAQGASILVDGPLLSTCLASLSQGALENTSGNVLLQVRHESERTLFVFVQADAQGSYTPQASLLDGPVAESSLAVRLTVARRDIDRMGGELRVEHTSRGLTCVTVEMPNRAGGERTNAERSR
jgi:hypothetical protein